MTEKLRRGLAAMSPEQRQRIAAMGGSAVKAKNRAFSRDSELAAEAGAKGGAAGKGKKRK